MENQQTIMDPAATSPFWKRKQSPQSMQYIAVVAYEARRAYACVINDQADETDWFELTDKERKLEASLVNYILSQDDIILPRYIHNFWTGKMLSAGWRHGEKYDRKQMLHPDLTSWQRLTNKQKQRYLIIRSVVQSFK